MTTLSIEALGVTKEQILEIAVDRMVAELLDGEFENSVYDKVLDKLNESLQSQVTAASDRIAEEHIGPKIVEQIEATRFIETNRWGEPKHEGEGMTFREYLISRADRFVTEPVNYEGKAKDDVRGQSFIEKQSRIAHMIDKHLHHEMARTVEGALKEFHEQLTDGLADTVKLKMKEVTSNLKLTIKR